MNFSLLSEDRLNSIRDRVHQCYHLPGDMAELGVYRGGTAKLMCETAPNKVMHLFDTFEGIPEDDEHPAGHHKKGDFPAPLETVAAYLAGHKCIFHKGTFPKTAAGTKFCFVHLDADTYQSTIAGIDYFWVRMTSGGIMVFDDFGWRATPGVERAVRERLPGVTVFQTAEHQAWVQKA